MINKGLNLVKNNFEEFPNNIEDCYSKQKKVALEISQVLKGAEKIFGSIMLRRMSLMWPLLGLCWCLILLNDFRQDYFLRRNGSAGEQATINRSRLMHQLARSEQLLGEIQSQYKNISYVS